MKKNIFDPFMQINFENAIKESKPTESSKENYNSFDGTESLFTEKRISFRTPQIMPGFTILVISESLGDKNEIGKKLLKDVIIEISDLIDLPEYIIFANNSVKFLDDNLDIIKKIKELKKFGTKILVSNESLKNCNMSNSFEFAVKLSSSDIAKRILAAKRLLQL